MEDKLGNSNFKIIAIKTGNNGNSPRNFLSTTKNGVDIDYLKNLKSNTVYSFYNNYSFINNDFTKIEYNSTNDIQLYSIKLINGINIPVNINAIVGENGSGKSTLIELIYWMNYNLGCKFELLKTWKNEKYLINENLDLELFYKINDELYCLLKFFEGSISKFEFKLNDNKFELPQKADWQVINNINDISDFFYSIVINYSQYALNSLEVGEWINPLFHKNDGYQTPIVLNPMREDGNVDINKERLLLSRRLQSNVLEKIVDENKLEESLRNLSNGKIATILNVTYNEKYIEKAIKIHGNITPRIGKEILEGLEKYFDYKYEERDTNQENFITIILKYIYYKLKKIVHNYPTYADFREEKSIKNISDLLGQIKDSDSHMTFKVKGAILHLKYFDKIYTHSKFNFEDSFEINIKDFSDLIFKEIKSSEPFLVNAYMMAMPSFFNVDVKPDKNLSTSNFSSGEKQRIFSLSSLIYHLINLNSVEKAASFSNYRFINIILDEIEMYYHPEWQRKYISDLIEYMGKINPDNLKNIEGINITFLTHSPFILSDIPSNNILRLIKGNPEKSILNEQTFGANIYDLLDNDFFMKSGFIGEYAMFKIKEVLDYIAENKYDEFKHVYFLKITNIIGDDIISGKLNQLLSGLQSNSLNTRNKIEFFKSKQKELEIQIKKLEGND